MRVRVRRGHKARKRNPKERRKNWSQSPLARAGKRGVEQECQLMIDKIQNQFSAMERYREDGG
jgi:hypothetical protein